VCAISGLVVAVWSSRGLAAPERRVEVVDVAGIIDANVERAVGSVVHAAERDGAALVVLELDSAGAIGAHRAERIAGLIRSARVPIAAWIGPPGARARNGAALIWFAAGARAMAPGTTVGPIRTLDLRVRSQPATIRRVVRDLGIPPASVSTTTTAVRAQASEWAQSTAPGLPGLIAGLDGRAVIAGGTKATIHADPARDEVRLHKLDLPGRLLHAAAQPSIAYLLLLLGLVGLVFEAFHPSTGPAGLTGAAAVALAVYAIAVLGGSWVGFALIVAGVAAFCLDLAYQSLGVFSAAGFAGLVSGSIVLFMGRWLRVSPLLIVGGVAAMTAFLLGAMSRVLRDLRLVASGRLEVRDAHDLIKDADSEDNGQGGGREP